MADIPVRAGRRQAQGADRAPDPCNDAPEDYWVWARREEQIERDTQKSGKWLIRINCPYVKRVWARVLADVRAGRLGPDAKVTTHMPSPQFSIGKHVICVYTKSFEDKVDILRVAKRLAITAKLKTEVISYKRDIQTLAGESVALYTFGPPYRDLGTPRVKKPSKPRDKDEGWDDDEMLYDWPYGPDD